MWKRGRGRGMAGGQALHRRCVKSIDFSRGKKKRGDGIGRGGSSDYASRVIGSSTAVDKNSHERADQYQVLVQGFPATANTRIIMETIQTRSGVAAVNNIQQLGHRLTFGVSTESEASAIAALSPLLFNGDKLSIMVQSTNTSHQNMSNSHLEKALVQYVTMAYDSRNRVLDCTDLQSHIRGVTVNLNDPSAMKLIWNALCRKCTQIESINFANNHMHTLRGLSAVSPNALPMLRNFCFSGNDITDPKEIDFMRRCRVRELDFRNNPVVNSSEYRAHVERLFANMRYLDGIKVDYLMKFNIHLSCNLPPHKPGFFDSEVTRTIARQFLTKFFQCFDADRQMLVDAYADSAFFSTTAKVSVRRELLEPFQRFNRNLSSVKNLDEQCRLLKYGRAAIVQMLEQLPRTAHKFSEGDMDCHVITTLCSTQLLCINSYGCLQIGDSELISFSRMFLLVPNSTPTAAVWPALIINDQLNLSEYTGPQIPVSAVDNIQQPQTDVCQTRDQLVSRLMQETRLQAVHATQCLENAGWIYDQAMASFRALQSMGGIPDSALVPMC